MTENYLTKHVHLQDLSANGYGSLLTCPACGCENTHHGDTEVFECGEDAAGIRVCVAAGAATVDTNMAGNPSARRHGLTISVECEGCGSVSLLGLEQHKGQTFLRWLRVGSKQH